MKNCHVFLYYQIFWLRVHFPFFLPHFPPKEIRAKTWTVNLILEDN